MMEKGLKKRLFCVLVVKECEILHGFEDSRVCMSEKLRKGCIVKHIMSA